MHVFKLILSLLVYPRSRLWRQHIFVFCRLCVGWSSLIQNELILMWTEYDKNCKHGTHKLCSFHIFQIPVFILRISPLLTKTKILKWRSSCPQLFFFFCQADLCNRIQQANTYGEISSDLYRASRCDGEKSTPPCYFYLKMIFTFYICPTPIPNNIFQVGSQTFRKPMVVFSIYGFVTLWPFFLTFQKKFKLCNEVCFGYLINMDDPP